MEKKSYFFVLVFLCLISITFVSSAQTTITNVNTAEGLQIFYPQLEVVKQNEDFNLHVHVSNISNGFPLTNIEVDCRLHLYDNTGNHTLESGILTKDSNGYDHEIYISPDNFSKLGQHAFYIWCNNTLLGGEAKGSFQVTKTGIILDSSESLLYFILAFGVIILFALSFYFMIATEYGNEVNEKGAVIKITKLKYVKLALILLTWVLFTWFLNILIGLSDNFVSLTMYYGFFGFMFTIMNAVALPMGVVIIVIMLFEIIRDANIMENIKKFGSSYK